MKDDYILEVYFTSGLSYIIKDKKVISEVEGRLIGKKCKGVFVLQTARKILIARYDKITHAIRTNF